MKVYTKIVMDMNTWDALEEQSYEYDGPVSECGSGGSSTTTVDKEYNRRMADIAEQQQGWATDYYEMWRDNFKDYEIAQARANAEMLPLETNLYKQQLESANALMPMQTEAAQQFLSSSLSGVDVNERIGLAGADVGNAWKDATAETARAAGRMGVNPNSGRFQGIQATLNTQKAAQISGAKTQARVGAEQENYERLRAASGFKPEFDANAGSYVSPIDSMMKGIGGLNS